jgi:hypothetical protein
MPNSDALPDEDGFRSWMANKKMALAPSTISGYVRHLRSFHNRIDLPLAYKRSCFDYLTLQAYSTAASVIDKAPGFRAANGQVHGAYGAAAKLYERFLVERDEQGSASLPTPQESESLFKAWLERQVRHYDSTTVRNYAHSLSTSLGLLRPSKPIPRSLFEVTSLSEYETLVDVIKERP